MTDSTIVTTTQPPDIQIPQATSPLNNVAIVPVNQEDFDNYKAKQKKITNWTFALITAAFLVCLIAVIGFLLDAWRFHSQTLEQYKQVILQNSKERENRDSIIRMRNELEVLKGSLNSLNKLVPVKTKHRKPPPLNIINSIRINSTDTVPSK